MHVNKTNGKVYIGQTKLSYHLRWNNGKGYGFCSRFAKAIKKYGWNGFEHIPLIEGLSKIDADYFERFFIAVFDSQNPEFGYNLTAGGDECPFDNPVVREHHCEAMKKRSANPEWKKNNREANQKRCKKVRCVETNIVYDSIVEAAVAVNLKISNNISFCCKGKRETAGGYHWEYADEMLKHKYKKYSVRLRKQKILCVETGVIYDSVEEAVVSVGLKCKECIFMCCKGKRETAGGYHWEFADEIFKNRYIPYENKQCKKVLCVETNIVYDSIVEATIAVNLKTSTSICSCCRGKQKTAGGYHWEYA